MRTIGDNALSIPTFSVDDIKDDSIAVEDKSIIERLVKKVEEQMIAIISDDIEVKRNYDLLKTCLYQNLFHEDF